MDCGQKYKFLCWNTVGSAALRIEDNFSVIDIDFANKQIAKNQILENRMKAELASMNYCGIFLARKAIETDIDEYEDETKSQSYISTVKFHPFAEWKKIPDWTFDLPKGESAEAIAVGTNWCAVGTTTNYIRFFSYDGAQQFITSTSLSIVSMCAYENLLAVVMHNGTPLLDQQNMRYSIYDTSSAYKIISEGQFPLSPNSELKWIGFSDEGQLCSFDTDGVLRMLSISFGGNWIPALDVTQKFNISPEKFFPIGVSENEVMCVVMKVGQKYPVFNDKSRVQTLKLQIPFLSMTKSKEEESENLANQDEIFLRHMINLGHEAWRHE